MTINIFPVQLDDYTVLALNCVANLQHDATATTPAGPYTLQLTYGGPSMESVAQGLPPVLDFHLTIEMTKNCEAAQYERIEIKLAGHFSLKAKCATIEDFKGFVVPHAMSLLFGVGRGIVGSVTSWFPAGKFILPSISATTFQVDEQPAPAAESDKTVKRRRKTAKSR